MRDQDCIDLLQRALPRLRMRWPGFRKVRKQVCKRIQRRMRLLGIASVDGYRALLEAEPSEWAWLDAACRITISRFYRDREVYAFLEREVMPALAAAARVRGDRELVAWSAGCASGEEPYSLALMWNLSCGPSFAPLTLRILATDANEAMLGRAAAARYPLGSLQDLPNGWRDEAFAPQDGELALRAPHRSAVRFHHQDIRHAMPDGPFDLVLCRNLVFTYFDEALQTEILERIVQRLCPGGALVIGGHERLPPSSIGLTPWSARYGVYALPPTEGRVVSE